LYLASKMKNKKLVPEVYARIQEDGEDCLVPCFKNEE